MNKRYIFTSIVTQVKWWTCVRAALWQFAGPVSEFEVLFVYLTR